LIARPLDSIQCVSPSGRQSRHFVFEVGASIESLCDGLPDPVAIVGMHDGEEALVRELGLAVHAHELAEALRQDELAGVDVTVPRADPGDQLGELEALLAARELLLGALALPSPRAACGNSIM
jgi:hypothetical protein